MHFSDTAWQKVCVSRLPAERIRLIEKAVPPGTAFLFSYLLFKFEFILLSTTHRTTVSLRGAKRRGNLIVGSHFYFKLS